LLSAIVLVHAVPQRFGVDPVHENPQVLAEQAAEPAPALGPGHAVAQPPQ
jgi:hypothetical protein